MASSRKDLRFPRIILEPIRHVLENRELGIRFQDVLDHLRVSRADYEDPAFTIDGEAFLALHLWLKDRTRSSIPLKDWLGYYSATSAGIAGLAALSALSARDALSVGIRFMPLLMPAMKATLVEGPVTSRLELDMIADLGRMNRFLLELTAGVVNIISRETMPEGIPRTIHFRHDAGVDARGRSREAEYREAYQCEVVFNSSFNGLVSPSRYLDEKTLRPNEATYRMANSILENDIQSRSSARSFTTEVATALMAQANAGRFPSLEEFAEQLHMSPRTLNRKLAKEDASFKQLANEAWFRLSRELLANRKIAIATVAERSGFTCRNAFSRAFKNLSGQTPQEWRDAHLDSKPKPPGKGGPTAEAG